MSECTWNYEKSRALYHLEYWGGGYFDINAEGEMIVYPKPGKQAINLQELAQSFAAHGLSLPVLVRFPDILHHRIQLLCEAFDEAMHAENYSARYTAVYPIKVNQQHHVVEEILHAGRDRVGLEAGSKSELMAVLALAPANGGTVICNGYKDREYIRLALIGQQLGMKPCLVIEKLSEVNLIIEESRNLGIRPRLGIRIRMASVGRGLWEDTGGEKAKFGLSAAQILQLIEHLKSVDLLSCLHLMHFHLGSQIGNVRDIQKAIREAGRYYAELRTLGVEINTLDVGGGLGVDYDGSRSRNSFSINYNVREYARVIVHEFNKICTQANLPFPDIITESGRAMTAHHAVLITNVIDTELAPGVQDPTPVDEQQPEILQSLWQGLNRLNQRSALEIYYDACYSLTEAHTEFAQGHLSLAQRAHAEQLYHITCQKVQVALQSKARLHREASDELSEKLADKFFCNFSLFQSVPDAWGIKQVFPIMPLHRLNERPSRRAKIQDLTCDSDGQFRHYVDSEGIGTSLPVHLPDNDQPYLLGIFLVGAYQEILGDMHNLFGDTFSVNVHLTDDGGYELVEPVEGDTVQKLLQYVNIDTDQVRNIYRKRLQAAKHLTAEQRLSYSRELDAGLMGYSYLEEH
ncbi:biosynthetic arginine decarboxylase [Thioflexithrix psekupsensis]|uniref:Biosynthetic arginine decarboxylase n=1 Tax=Thioflexithrix psekupsensis TaxID=1570016 RepID=A0A251XA93_9GAMM|nr:biosynthetic arginine decarboxylase [Thioflexithrix psekupsensis]OUD15352.1 arginine decarboxylase [Thioflexithrix psekupsensis]